MCFNSYMKNWYSKSLQERRNIIATDALEAAEARCTDRQPAPGRGSELAKLGYCEDCLQSNVWEEWTSCDDCQLTPEAEMYEGA